MLHRDSIKMLFTQMFAYGKDFGPVVDAEGEDGEWLLELLVPHYSNPHDVRALLRSFAELSGEIRTTTDGVVITLDAPDLPLHRRALHGLCADLNHIRATYPGTDLPVLYQVAVHHSEALK